MENQTPEQRLKELENLYASLNSETRIGINIFEDICTEFCSPQLNDEEYKFYEELMFLYHQKYTLPEKPNFFYRLYPNGKIE